MTLVQSSPADALSEAPMKSTASAISLALRVSVPLSSRLAVNPARPWAPSGSRAEPLLMLRSTDTTGCSWFSTTISSAPFESVRLSYSGKATGASGGGGGGPS